MIGTSVVTGLESILPLCPPNTLGVAVIPSKTNYTKDAFRRTAISKYNIILTKDNEFYLDMKKAIDNLNNNNTLTNEKELYLDMKNTIDNLNNYINNNNYSKYFYHFYNIAFLFFLFMITLILANIFIIMYCRAYI